MKGDNLRIGVIGLGHVGLPTALGLCELGWDVVGTDADVEKARAIAAGKAPFYEPDLEGLLQKHLQSGRFRVANDTPSVVQDAEVLFVCVGTPVDRDGSADLSQVEAVARVIAQNLNGYKLVVEKSTTPVQTAEALERTINRYAKGASFDVAVNPEFLREGSAVHDFLYPDRIILGVDSEKAKAILTRIYSPLLEHLDGGERRLVVVNRRTAELIKHAANAFLATKISFINLLADLCEAAGADVEQVALGLGLDPRIGPHYLKAGVGYGGYCLPKDLKAFIRVGQSFGISMRLLMEVDAINDARPQRLVEKVRRALWVLKSKEVAIWGLAFKPNTDDVREAPSLKVVSHLLRNGCVLRLHDPWAIPSFRSHYPEKGGRLTYVRNPEEAVEGADALVLLTEWPEYREVDFRLIKERMRTPLIVDGRNFLDKECLQRLGFEYYGMGR